MTDFNDLEPQAAQPTGRDRYLHLPEHVKLEDTVETVDTEDAPDPNGGRDPETDFMLRNSGF